MSEMKRFGKNLEQGAATDPGLKSPMKPTLTNGLIFSAHCFLVPITVLAGLSQSQALAQSAVQLFRNVEPSVSFIVTDKGGGTGFCVGASGLVATSLHVVQDSKQVSISFSSGRRSDKIELLAVNTDADLALLRAKGMICKPVPLGNSDAVQTGQRIFVIGNPLARQELKASLTDGLISGIRKLENGQKVVQISAPLSPGNSGGPVLTESGTVVGIVAFKLTSGELLNFAIPSNELASLIEGRSDIALHEWGTGDNSLYNSGGKRIAPQALRVFERARRVMGTCSLEDAAWETIQDKSKVKIIERRDFGSLHIYTVTGQDGKDHTVIDGKNRNGRWTKIDGVLVKSTEIKEDDILNNLVDNWYAFCPGMTSLWKDVEVSMVSAEGRETDRIKVKDPFYGSTIFFDFSRDTGFLTRRQYVNKGTGEPILLTDEFSDFRQIETFIVPFVTVQTSIQGTEKRTIRSTFTSFSPNNGYPEYVFDK